MRPFLHSPTHCPSHSVILPQVKISSPFPPAVSSSCPLPAHLLAPPAMPSLSDCFPCASVNLGNYVLYSSALIARKCAGLHPLQCHLVEQVSRHFFWTNIQLQHNGAEDNCLRKKTQTMHYIYAWRDTEDGLLEIILPQELL